MLSGGIEVEHWLKIGLKEKLIKEPSKENTTRGGEGGG